MADINNDSNHSSPSKNDSLELQKESEPSQGDSNVDNEDSKESPTKDELNSKEDDKSVYTAGTRGFPPSRPIARGAFAVNSFCGISRNPFDTRSSTKLDNESTGESSNPSINKWPGLTPSRLGKSPPSPGGGGGSGTPISRPVLRPPQLATPSSLSDSPLRSSNFPLNPPRLGNPFAKALTTPIKNNEEESNEKVDKNIDSSSQNSSAQQTTSPVRFVPLGGSVTSSHAVSQDSASTPASSSSFVFGQNLHERVVDSPSFNHTTPSTSKQSENGFTEAGSSSSPSTNGTGNSSGEMLFSTAIINTNSENGEPIKSLSEAAREYEESRSSVKRKYEQVAVKTGEEDETNVIQVTAKLYAFDKTNTLWKERGHGQLRLNDKCSQSGGFQSRIIMRTFGSLRLLLNTKVWAGMAVDRASSCNLRITAMDAMDDDKIKVFLIKTSNKDSDSLYTALQRRVADLRQRINENSEEVDDVEDEEEEEEEEINNVSTDEIKDNDLEPSLKKSCATTDTVIPTTDESQQV